MKSKIKNKKSGSVNSADQKFINEQKYSEQSFQLDDPSRDIPEYIDEKGIIEDIEDDTDWEKLKKEQ